MYVSMLYARNVLVFHTAWTCTKEEGCKKTKEGKEESPEESAWNQESESFCWKEEVDFHHVLSRTHTQ